MRTCLLAKSRRRGDRHGENDGHCSSTAHISESSRNRAREHWHGTPSASNRTYRKVTGAFCSTCAANLYAAVRILPPVGSVQNLVALPTKRDQVGLCIVTQGAAQYHVVNIEILGASTFLTAPTITLQDFSAQTRIYLRSLSNSRVCFQSRIIHVACSL